MVSGGDKDIIFKRFQGFISPVKLFLMAIVGNITRYNEFMFRVMLLNKLKQNYCIFIVSFIPMKMKITDVDEFHVFPPFVYVFFYVRP